MDIGSRGDIEHLPETFVRFRRLVLTALDDAFDEVPEDLLLVFVVSREEPVTQRNRLIVATFLDVEVHQLLGGFDRFVDITGKRIQNLPEPYLSLLGVQDQAHVVQLEPSGRFFRGRLPRHWVAT